MAFSLCCYLKNISVIPPGPSVAISEVTKSLWESGSLTPSYFFTTYHEAAAFSKETSSDVWQDVFALDKRGNLLPKHSMLSAILAVPFYALFGIAGFWILQQVVLLGVLYATYCIVEDLTAKNLPWIVLISTMFLTQTLFYSYEFNYDLHGCALLIGGLNLLRRSGLWGSVVIMLSVFVRPSSILLSLPLVFIGTRRFAALQKKDAVIGTFAVLGLFLMINYLWWGDPFVTTYSRLPSFHKGEMVLLNHPFGFNWEVFLSDWSMKLFSKKGIVSFNLSLIALPLVFISVLYKGSPFEKGCVIIAVGYALYIFSYPMWSATYYGNRFLLPAIYLYLIPFITVTSRMFLQQQMK